MKTILAALSGLIVALITAFYKGKSVAKNENIFKENEETIRIQARKIPNNKLSTDDKFKWMREHQAK